MIIGIGGISRSGKSFLARSIAEALKTDDVLIISQDDRIVAADKMPLVRNRIDWENPYSIDHSAISEEVAKNERSSRLIIVEGLFAFFDPVLRAKMQHKIFIELPRGIFFRRKYLDKRWGYEPPWYIEHIWRSYLRYGRLHSKHPDYTMLDGGRDFPHPSKILPIKDIVL